MKKPLLFTKFQFKVTIILIISMLLVGSLSSFLIYRFALSAQLNSLRDKLKVIALTATLTIDPDMLISVPLQKDGMDTAQYKTIAEKLKKIKDLNPTIRYIYTMAKTQEDGILQFIVDPDPETVYTRKERTAAYPGARYDGRRFPEMLNAFSGPSADKNICVDEWGHTISGYAPIKNIDGRVVAILGVDMMAPEVFEIQKVVHREIVFVLIFGLILSIILGTVVSRGITIPISNLVTGTRHISNGDLQYEVAVKRNDELGELADCFNAMTGNLRQYRAKIHDYFYDVIQSLVRIVEARDSYTRGHSERVAEFAGKIAVKMGYSEEDVEIIKETALLHDIGKLGIQESILNKREKLTEEEWLEIRKHPIIGENILKPITLDKRMLEIVRGHHERYNGTGYPDKLKGNEINIFAQILFVADAYDAMTSQRAYRPNFTREEAVKELVSNKWTQFNPKIVDIFVEILKE